ncbi:GNAT family N-acetyltransferase [Pseudomonas sp. KNUC1026]|uniref:GNAT family N-acetyltransferase n=1 Tax=Pseudomonas sp. KNUC1026 TaxID=2893890 RepID=UPI002E31F708|nr:GNAT family N-acetyltransferase [Pseudomonas sp. KNUC1026]
MVRLYVQPNLRRAGLGSALFERLQQHAEAGGVRQLYLHTHPFLPGAVGFWERQGFHTLLAEAEPVWQTHHMLKTL